MKNRLRIVVCGMAGLYPLGGVAWDYLQYVIGLAALGHDVYYHEDTWRWPYHPVEKRHTSDGSYSARYIRDFFESYAPEMQGRWHYLHLHERHYGMDSAAFDGVARTADLFLNVSGACAIPDELPGSCVKVFIDTDPGYNQIMLSERFDWSENVERWCAGVASHDQFFTYAENIHGPDCLIPKLAFEWKTTRMPIVLPLWEPLARRQPPEAGHWTTVLTWNDFKGRLIFRGVEYQSKGYEFERLLALPREVDMPLQVAVGGVNAPRELLANHGWVVVDGPGVTLKPADYQNYIAGSRGELSPAKHVYVAMRSGWFSCRSACYLAAGRPVVVQDTGFTATIPAGKGILPFNTTDEAVDALREAEGNYNKHAKAARELAEAYFKAETVTGHLLEDALAV